MHAALILKSFLVHNQTQTLVLHLDEMHEHATDTLHLNLNVSLSSTPSFTVCRLLEVDIGIAQRPARDHVPTHPDGEDGSGRAKLLVEHGFGHVLVQVSNI